LPVFLINAVQSNERLRRNGIKNGQTAEIHSLSTFCHGFSTETILFLPFTQKNIFLLNIFCSFAEILINQQKIN
jgi:hypothetical protein